MLGALASTTQLKLTTAVTCPSFRIHPAVIAQAAATTAVLAPGRFTLGVGAGEALTAHRLWGHEPGGGHLAQDAPMWLQYEAVAELTSLDDMANTVPCGPDAARAAEAIAEYVEAGFHELYIAQMGPGQEGGIRFLAEEVLPLLNTGT